MSGPTAGLDLWMLLPGLQVLVTCLLMSGAALALFRLGDLFRRPALQAAAAGLALLTIQSFGGFIVKTAATELMISGSISMDYSFVWTGLHVATGCASFVGWCMVSGGLIAAMLEGEPR